VSTHAKEYGSQVDVLIAVDTFIENSFPTLKFDADQPEAEREKKTGQKIEIMSKLMELIFSR
jgi:hypothetical protein